MQPPLFDFMCFWNFAKVMPDHLPKTALFVGEDDSEDSAELREEREWLASSIRGFVGDESGGAAPKHEKQHRLSCYWWLIMLDQIIRQVTGQGLEQFSSPESAAATAKAGEGRTKLKEDEILWFQRLMVSKRFAWQWLGLPIDQCSIGPCSVGFLKRVLRLYTEPIYDPAHRTSNDILGGTKLSGNFYLLLIMKALYGLNTACWKTCK